MRTAWVYKKLMTEKNSQMTMRIMQRSWTPEPSRELRIMGYWGGLKTSPWTFFHPDSSMVSSWLQKQRDTDKNLAKLKCFHSELLAIQFSKTLTTFLQRKHLLVMFVFSYYVIFSVVVGEVLPQGADDDHAQNTWERKGRLWGARRSCGDGDVSQVGYIL